MNVELLLTAIMLVESGGDANAVGDRGRSIGPYQIQYSYWLDSGVPGSFKMCRNKTYARKVVKAYWKRHEPKAVKRNDLKSLARLHNGGPNWRSKSSTVGYWNKVRNHMKGSSCRAR
jgi:hypothetical protein